MLSRLLPIAAGFAVLAVAISFARAQDINQYCQTNFMALKGNVDKNGQALQAANKRHANIMEACTMFKNYVEAEAKMIKFMGQAKDQCGIPDQVIKNFNAAHAKAVEMRTKVCNAAANGGVAAAPNAGLSSALGINGVGVNPDNAGNSGVFDTLNGNVLK